MYHLSGIRITCHLLIFPFLLMTTIVEVLGSNWMIRNRYVYEVTKYTALWASSTAFEQLRKTQSFHAVSCTLGIITRYKLHLSIVIQVFSPASCPIHRILCTWCIADFTSKSHKVLVKQWISIDLHYGDLFNDSSRKSQPFRYRLRRQVMIERLAYLSSKGFVITS